MAELHPETRLKQELQKVRREFYQYQLKKDAELQRLLAHSKSQSQTVQALQDSLQEKEHALASFKNENKHNKALIEEHQEMISNQHKDLVSLQRQKEELARDLAAAKATAEIYREDFERERNDRARAAGKIESLERTVIKKVQALAQKTNELSEVEEATKKWLDGADEDLKVKAAQIKNYKKQVDSLQVQLKEAQQTLALLEKEESDMVFVSEPYPIPDPVDVNASIKLSKKDQIKMKLWKKSAAAKAEEKVRMKAKKLEREKSVKETLKRRKVEIEEMEEAKLKVFLEKEINHLENENMGLKHQLECSEATIKSLVEKLRQTEELVLQVTGSSSPVACPHNPPRARTSQGNRQSTGHLKRKSSSTSYVCSPTQHEGIHQQVHRRNSSTEAYPVGIESNLDAKIPGMNSKKRDYVNVPPNSLPPPRPPPPRSRTKAESPVEGPRLHKSPKPTPRSFSVEASRRLAVPDQKEQSISMPPMPMKREEDEQDISHGLEDDIYTGAREVVETGLDERRYTLTSIPFDPFLECLYCNQKFRYGEIQKYRKHVNNCTGTSAV